MKPSQAAAIALAVLLCLAATSAVSAQGSGDQAPGGPAAPDGPPAPSGPTAGEFGDNNPFLPGEQTIGLSAGVQVPLFMAPDNSNANTKKLLTGGVFSFQYQYFVSRGLALGGSISGAFNGTIGGRSLFVAPLAFRTAYWWSFLPFELCAAVEAGGFLMRLDTHGMFGPFGKLGGEVLWRVSPGWSLGVKSYFWVVPEIHTGSYSSLTRTGGFAEVAMAAVYHL